MKLVQFLLWAAQYVAGLASDPRMALVKADLAKLLGDVKDLASTPPPPK